MQFFTHTCNILNQIIKPKYENYKTVVELCFKLYLLQYNQFPWILPKNQVLIVKNIRMSICAIILKYDSHNWVSVFFLNYIAPDLWLNLKTNIYGNYLFDSRSSECAIENFFSTFKKIFTL